MEHQWQIWLLAPHTTYIYGLTFWITLSLALLERRLNPSSFSDGVIGLLVSIVPFKPCIVCLIHDSFSLLSPSIFLISLSSTLPSPLPVLLSMILRKVCFTILSSKLWKEMTASLPPGARQSKQAYRESSSVFSSSLTVILRAWNTLVAVFIQPCRPPVSH